MSRVLITCWCNSRLIATSRGSDWDCNESSHAFVSSAGEAAMTGGAVSVTPSTPLDAAEPMAGVVGLDASDVEDFDRNQLIFHLPMD
jgi:hypothetical protein